MRNAAGSSPRLWGTLGRGFSAPPLLRFIPTLVGNTILTHNYETPCPVHPHACGEHTGSRLYCYGVNGSSPRLWGTHLLAAEIQRQYRFIPTLVGNTSSDLFTGSATSVHPHACGEHSVPQKTLFRTQRFIPTLVGNTSGAQPFNEAGAVHPHACGEHWHPISP